MARIEYSTFGPCMCSVWSENGYLEAVTYGHTMWQPNAVKLLECFVRLSGAHLVGPQSRPKAYGELCDMNILRPCGNKMATLMHSDDRCQNTQGTGY